MEDDIPMLGPEDIQEMDFGNPEVRITDTSGREVSRKMYDGEQLLRKLWNMLGYLEHSVEDVSEICLRDNTDIDSLEYALTQIDHAENILGSMRNQIERPLLEELD